MSKVDNILEITPLEDLVEASQGIIVELPPFTNGKPFVAKIKRPSLLVLVKEGKVPNDLLNVANKLFVGNGVKVEDSEGMKSLFKVIDVLAEACFVEPTYAELKGSGVELTDEQFMFIFNFAQKGVKSLKNFR